MNTTFRLCPWADVLYAMDAAWWKFNLAEVERTFSGARISPTPVQGARRVQFRKCRNSGAGSIALAAHWGAQRIGLLGFDCQYTNGKTHWHGDHPEGAGAGNAGSLPKWPQQFEQLAQELRAIEVVNLTRETALQVWPRGNLEAFLDS